MSDLWSDYASGKAYDELISERGSPRLAARRVINHLLKLPHDELVARQSAADLSIKEMGISFTVYTESGNIDRAWPYDIIPQIGRAHV